MEREVTTLRAALGLSGREHIALVGAGGKTSLMCALALELSEAGCRVVTATTTKVRHDEARRAQHVVFSREGGDWSERVQQALALGGFVFVGHRLLDSRKVEGIAPTELDALYADPRVEYVILEADGAAGRPIKAPAAHEPVIPDSTTLVVALMGLEALGKPLDSGVVFRSEIFREITGLMPGGVLDPAAIARVFQLPEGLFKGAPPSARRAAFLNKRDLLPEEGQTEKLAELLCRPSPARISRVVSGSLVSGRYTILEECR